MNSTRIGMTQGEYINELESWRQRTANYGELIAALRALVHQCEYMGAPKSHADMAAARAALAKVQP